MKKILPAVVLGLFAFACIAKADSLFNRNLYFGIQNDPDVVKLQEFLTGKGFYSGPVNGNFFSLTLEAVKAFQAGQGIDPPTGYFGPTSREKANGLLAASGGAPTPSPSTISAIQTQLLALLQQVAALQKQLQVQQRSEQALQTAKGQTARQTATSTTITTVSVTTSTVSTVPQSPVVEPPPDESAAGQINPPPPSSNFEFLSVMLGVDPACGSFSGGTEANRSRTVVDNVSCFEFAADSAGLDVHLKSLTLSFSGGALDNAGAFTVSLIDPQTQIAYDGSSQQSCTPVNGACSSTFNFSGTPLSGGQIKGIVVQVNSASFSNAVGQNDGLDITLNSRDTISWDDGITTSGIPSDVSVPILLTHVDYQ